jgi:hypothetical protein
MNRTKHTPPNAGKGRPKGAVNLATREIRGLAQSLLNQNYFEKLKTRLLAGKIAPAVECKLLAYAFGEPKQSFEHSGSLAVLTTVVHEHHPRA